MLFIAQGIPELPDLTHPNELIEFGKQLLGSLQTIALLVGALGIIIVLFSFALNRNETQKTIFLDNWLGNYSLLLRGLQHGILVLAIAIFGFFLCSTLANRYHHWEQSRIAQVADSVAGERLEQPAPKIRYVIEEPYTDYNYVDGKTVEVQRTRQSDRYLAPVASEIQVKIDRARNRQNSRDNYLVDFSALYQVTNPLREEKQFFFEASPPQGYAILQNLRVEQEGKRLDAINLGDYGFPFRLQPSQSARFRVLYQAQGAPRWVYNAQGELLSNFRLTVNANFPNADFASGIVPSQTKDTGSGTIFTWEFKDNVSVTNPFGVFTATAKILNSGVMPRLLLLAPGLFLWWLLMLYLSLPMTWRNVALSGALFFACLLALTYLSRGIDANLAWSTISIILLILVWGLGKNRSASLAAVICTISGAILPVFGLLIPYSGLTLSLAGLLSVIWLAVRNWYWSDQFSKQ